MPGGGNCSKKLAIMQPYLFPYLGYWQLLAAVDKLVLLDDVNYINRGWINRNRVAVNAQPAWLTLPLQGASQNRLICDIDIAADDGWKGKMRRMLAEAYARAPESKAVLALFEQWLAAANGNLSAALYTGLGEVARYLGVTTEIVPSSRVYPKNGLKGEARILDICRREGADVYVNLPGGRDLYDAKAFREAGIELQFLQPDLHAGALQSGVRDGSVLSILDSMMYNPQDKLAAVVTRFELQAA